MPSSHISLFEADIVLICQDIDRIARKNGLTRKEVYAAVELMVYNEARLKRAQSRLIDFTSDGLDALAGIPHARRL